MFPRGRPLRVLVELPVRKDQPNATVLSKLKKFDLETLDALVLSDKAGGLDRFCDAEEMVERGLIRKLKEDSGLSIWNVLRTGDRCTERLRLTLQQLKEQGSSRVLLVSGHDYRTKLRLQAEIGELCSKACCRVNGTMSPPSILCGRESSQVLSDENTVGGIELGAVLHGPNTLQSKSNASFFVTQACPTLNTFEWASAISFISPKPVYVTVIPILSLKELDRVRALGSNVPREVEHELSGSILSARDRGMEMARTTLDALRRVANIAGVYLYHHNLDVLPDLAQYAKKAT